MKSTIEALQDIYISLGGLLTDTYDNINDGSPVGDYATVPDIAEAISKKATTGEKLPDVTSEDNGDILSVVNGEWAKADAPSELPTVSDTDAGKVLTVNSSGAWVADSVPKELPSVTQSDEGKILAVNNSGSWAAKSTDDWETCNVVGHVQTATYSFNGFSAKYSPSRKMLKFSGSFSVTNLPLNLGVATILEVTSPTLNDFAKTAISVSTDINLGVNAYVWWSINKLFVVFNAETVTSYSGSIVLGSAFS